jgi:hypothetical protein
MVLVLSSCNFVESFKEIQSQAEAAATILEKDVGTKPSVGWNIRNDTFTTLNVVFDGSKVATLSVRELESKVRRAVSSSFKEQPEQLIVSTRWELPEAVKESLAQHLKLMKQQHRHDLEHGMGRVSLPNALEPKYPNGGQWVFPATSHFTDRVTGEQRRHHLHESVLQRAFKEARLQAGVSNWPDAIRCVIHLPLIY